MTSLSFEKWFLNIVREIATKSKDDSTKVGALIVGANNEIKCGGYNGFPIGANDEKEEWKKRPKKYLFTSHAEENAIVLAARNGIKTEGCSLYVTHFPCATCMRMIIQSGIQKVFIPEDYKKTQGEKDFSERWREQRLAAIEMANDCGIQIIRIRV